MIEFASERVMGVPARGPRGVKSGRRGGGKT